MGVDAKWGRFPICPEMSRFVPVCPLLSRFVPVPGPNRDKRGQSGTKRDISGQIGKRTPPFSIYPHLALLKSLVFPDHHLSFSTPQKWPVLNPESARFERGSGDC